MARAGEYGSSRGHTWEDVLSNLARAHRSLVESGEHARESRVAAVAVSSDLFSLDSPPHTLAIRHTQFSLPPHPHSAHRLAPTRSVPPLEPSPTSLFLISPPASSHHGTPWPQQHVPRRLYLRRARNGKLGLAPRSPRPRLDEGALLPPPPPSPLPGAASTSANLNTALLQDFDACSLCLRHARDPRTCPDGHVYCQECILEALVAQKKDIRRQQVLLERMRTESEADMARARADARDRVLREFETAQSSLGGSKPASGSSGSGLGSGAAAKGGATKVGEDGAPRGTKRVFELDEDEIERLTQEKTQEALSQTARDMAEARKAKLPNFWLVRSQQTRPPPPPPCQSRRRAASSGLTSRLPLPHPTRQPSLTPSATPENIIDVKLQTLCHAGKRPHPVSLKALTPVHFTEDPAEKTASGSPVVLCPSCRKSITNNVKAFVLKACGHVLWCALLSPLPFLHSLGSHLEAHLGGSHSPDPLPPPPPLPPAAQPASTRSAAPTRSAHTARPRSTRRCRTSRSRATGRATPRGVASR